MSDTTPRDQLADIISRVATFEEGSWALPEDVADAIIAAGWRPPARVVTTVEELDALAEGTVVLESGRNWCFVSRKLGNNYWLSDGIEYTFSSSSIHTPATVIYEPEEGE